MIGAAPANLAAHLPAVRRAIEILHAPGDCVEIRALGIPGYRGAKFSAAGYFNDFQKAAHAASVYSDKGTAGLYITMNPVDPALLARYCNRIKDKPDRTTTDAEIVRRRWMIFDIDPARPAGIAATDAEQQAARAVAHECEQHLRNLGWPLPVIGSSGNGYALFYRIDLPNDDASKSLISDVLKAVDRQMRSACGDEAHVDLAMFNAARIVRAFGTANRKGDGTPDRPHRIAELFDPPDEIGTVTAEQLREVAAAVRSGDQPGGNGQGQPATTTTGRPRLDVGGWLTARGRGFQLHKTSDGRDRYQIDHCVFNASHTGTSACFMQDAAGKPSYKCHHSSCAGMGWQQAKQVVGLPSPDHYDPPLGAAARATAPDRLAAGTKVKAGDRDNFGEVVADHGRTVAVRFVSPEGQSAVVDLPRTKLTLSNGAPVAGGSVYWPELLTSADFDSGNYNQRFLVKQILVAGQHAIIGGRMKTLKTTIGVDLCVSLGTGTPFLGKFDTVHAKTAILSGESGAFTLRETARRIAASRDVRLADVDVLWGFDLPQIARGDHLDSLAELIELHGIEVLLIDPAYLCLLGGDTQGKQAANLFDMGPILLGLSDVAKWTDSTIVLLHHCRKNTADIYAPPELAELSMSGFAEWARQWLLLGRREAYEQDSGIHRLWLNVGGSAGHSGCWAVNIDEGVLGDDFSGRKWDVEVNLATDAKREATQRRETQRAEQLEQKQEGYRRRLLGALTQFQAGETAKQLRTTSGLNSENFAVAIQMLLKEGRADACEVMKGNRKFDGFKPTGK